MVYIALLSRSTFILSFALHLTLQRCVEHVYLPPVSYKQIRIYSYIGFGLSIVEIFNSYSMTQLPGSIYALLKSSDIGWSMLLSSVFLHKTYTKVQFLSAILIVIGISWILKDAHGGNSGDDEDGDQEGASKHSVSSTLASSSYWYAMVICLCATFINAFCSVITEGTLKQTLKEG